MDLRHGASGKPSCASEIVRIERIREMGWTAVIIARRLETPRRTSGLQHGANAALGDASDVMAA